MSIRAGFLVQKLDGQAKVTDDTGGVVSNEDIFALKVPVSNRWFLCEAIHYPLVVEMCQAWRRVVGTQIYIICIIAY